MKKFTYSFIVAIAASLIMGSSAFGQIALSGGSVATSTTSATQTTNGADLVIAKPSGLQAGHIMIATITQNDDDGANGGDLSNVTSAGWILIDGKQLGALGSGGDEWHGTVLYRIATSADAAASVTGYTFDIDADAAGSIGGIVAFSGVNTSNPFDVAFPVSPINLALADDLAAPSVLTVTENAAIVMVGMIGDNRDVDGWNLGLSELFDINSGDGADMGVAAAWFSKVTPSATGAGAGELENNESDYTGAMLIALRPAPPTVAINPPALTISTLLVGQSLNLTATRSANITWNGGGNTSWNFNWTSTGPAAVTLTNDPVNLGSGVTASSTAAGPFTVAGTYQITCTVTEAGAGGQVAVSSVKTVNVIAAPPTAANLWATSSNGTQVSHFVVASGTYFDGPDNDFAPSFGSNPGTTTTAALGKGVLPNPAQGHFYYLPNTGTNGGSINIYGANYTGTTINVVGSIDANGGGTNDLGFVRLAMGPDGRGWILAGDGSNVYLSKFVPSGVGAGSAVTSTEDNNGVTLVGGAAATFQNGDLCLDGNGTIYALANDGAGVTQIFRGTPAGNATTLTKRFDLVDNTGAPFNGRVNGVAFDALGSMYISTDNGLYFIDAGTVNGPAGTVGCFLVSAVAGLQDLASNVFPTQTTLPVSLVSFSGSYRNQLTTLSWDAENMQNFSHFEIERSSDGVNFTAVGIKQPSGNTTSMVNYQHIDNLAAASGKVFYYRLKMVDNDGQFKYSNVILVRKEGKITGITVSPNPVISGDMVTVRFESSAKATVDFRLTDMSGRVVAKQQNSVTEGTNSVSIANLSRLQPGMYILQMNDGAEVQTAKLIIAK